MIVDKKRRYDGMLSFIGGQNAGIMPHLVLEDESSELWNCTVRGGSLNPRPGYRPIGLTFPTEEMEEWFKTKKNQGVEFHTSRNGRTVQIWSVGGRFFTVDVNNSGMVQEITPTGTTTTAANFTVPAVGSSVAVTVADADFIRVGYPIQINGKIYNVTAKSGSTLTAVNVDDTPAAGVSAGAIVIYLDVNSQNVGIVYMIQAEDFLIAQDGISKPFIFDGGSSRRSMTEKGEVPTGTVMAYGIGRLWVAIPGRGFVAGDIVYGPTGTPAYDKRDAILKFTENTFIAGGGAFVAPGEITAMAFVSSLDTSTGQGPLMVFTETAVLSVNAPVEREAWALVQNPIVTTSLIANGAMSFYGTVPTVNGDIFYRAIDGLRSFFLSRREVGSWGNTPISGEMDNVLPDDAEDLLKYQSAIVFNNRLLFTLASRPDRYGAYWKGIGALDFDTISTMKGKTPPVYDGTWTGVDPVWLVVGKYGRVERAFIAAINADNENELWEISTGDQFDDTDGRIKWTVISRGFPFQNPLEMLRLENLEMFIKNVIGDCDITVSYRSDDYPCWFPWTADSVCANYRRCEAWENCETPIAFRGGYKTRISFGQPQDVSETADGKPARLGYIHQLKIEIEGYCEVQKYRLTSTQVDEEPAPPVDLPEVCQEINCCPDDYFAWRSVDASEPGGESTT